MKSLFKESILAKVRVFLASLALLACSGGQAATTDIAGVPLIASATTEVLPNLMFVLDDSGSMAWDYLPDWVNDSGYCKGTACSFGKAPYNASDFNNVYYNPAITYTAPKNADGTSWGNISAYTSVKNDAYNVQSTSSTNLLTSYSDVMYCNDTCSTCSSTCSATNCLRNDNYLLPGTVGGVSYTNACNTTAAGTGRYATGSFTSPTTTISRAVGPYYYTIIPGEYCTAPNLRTCTIATVPTGSYTYPAKLRWCNNTALTNCQAIKTATYNKIRYPGVSIAGSSGTSATATITFSGSGNTSVGSITVNGQEIMSVASTASTSTGTVATNVQSRINACTSSVSGNCQTSGFSAVRSGSTLTITAPASMGAITFTPVITMAGSGATATITVNDPPGSNTSTSFSGITVNNQQIMSAASSGNTSTSTVATNIATRINACTGSTSGSCQVAGFSATASSNVVTITAPVSMGGITYLPVITKAVGTGNITATPAAFVVPGVMTATPTAFTGGVDPTSVTYVPGSFVRVDIVPGTTSYPYPGTTSKHANRGDCAGTTCSYAEEMTNFANWWTYYRTRMQMMKSATSLAFQPIDERYRVGFFTISTSSTSTGSNFLNIGKYDATQKSTWFTKLFASNPSSNTPLREALSKAGRIFAGKVGSDPMEYSCQQNFTILSTDGYWNGSTGYKMDGSTAMDDQDGSAARPMLDGNHVANTLADVAYYYYVTDLRNSGLSNCTGSRGTDVCTDNVPVGSKDLNTKQHMTTFTLGLGIDGYMQFSPTYETDASGDYNDVRIGTVANPSAGVCSWATSGATCEWPAPSSDSQANIDDLWHAAVNGHGSYFSAKSPSELASGLSNALAGVSARVGAAAAATTSNPNVTSGDNFVFSSIFTTAEWTGDLYRQQLNLETGAVSSSKDWSAQVLLDARTGAGSDTRTIYTYDPSGGNKLKNFLYANLSSAEQAYFGASNVALLSQGLSGANLTDASGEALVNFIRGQRGNEGTLYRQRTHVLGDIVSAEAVYVKAPMYEYADSGYGGFKSSNSSRQGVVFAASNDGMLHAFNSDTGQELWAYVPSLVMSNLYKLADAGYGAKHQYFVDGTPTVGDAYIGGSWKTILVGGLNGGGRGYYALDVTDPVSPKGLWEFTYDTAAGGGYIKDANLGYTFGNPVITKKVDGTWVVLVTSGYNNVSPGDGVGHMYVLNAANGTIIDNISSGAGNTTSPSGLARLAAWTENGMVDNTGLRAYGGDMQGNLFRFDFNDNVGAPGMEAQQIAYFRNGSGVAQPITTKPELGDVDGKAVVFVGTGRYLGVSDLTDTTVQSFYAIKDSLGTASIGNARSAPGMIQQTVSSTTAPSGAAARTTSVNTVDFATGSGWFFDLPDNGERNNTDSTLALGTLVFTTNVPNTSACTVGGYSWIYFVDYRTGSFITTSAGNVAALSLGNTLATRPVVVRLPNNTIVSLTKQSDTETKVTNTPKRSPSGPTRRVSWRELVNDQ
ncbi:MAG: PQQ-binding-like beta-propeller repeat protein [Sulfuricella sp.]|nr:PQQ-binding-like beta-propeller repeat protein [Sulfuricella sp.]